MVDAQQSRADDSDTSVSFLDVIACAFGAIALLVLILPIGELADGTPIAPAADYGHSLMALENVRQQVATAQREVAENDQLARVLGAELTSATEKASYLQNLIDRTRTEAEQLRQRIAAVNASRRVLEQPPPPTRKETKERMTVHAELAGIPVDSEYIAFVVDTSGSMRVIWDAVIGEVTNVLSLYPQVRGFQILNDQGNYLFGGNQRRWIPDSPDNRRRALDRMRNWLWMPYSASNPAPGIATAVGDLYDKDRNMAIFVFGDDYASNDFDAFLNRIDRAVASARTAAGSFRIHAIGFSNEGVSGSPLNFGVLMRELTHRHAGAFLALPEQQTPPRVAIGRGQPNMRAD